jgi:hypothetical protein
MKIEHSLLGAAFAFVLATSCCWLPFVAVPIAIGIGGAAGLSAFSAGLEKWSGLLMALGAGLAGWAGWQFFQKRKAKPVGGVVLQSLLTCPSCGFQKTETMPTDACQFFYECENCHQLLRPKPGDCCVFCSYGSVKCPPIQAGESCC